MLYIVKDILEMVFINNAVLFGSIVALVLITATQENNSSEPILKILMQSSCKEVTERVTLLKNHDVLK